MNFDFEILKTLAKFKVLEKLQGENKNGQKLCTLIKLSKKNHSIEQRKLSEKELSYAANSDFLIPSSLLSEDLNFRLFDLIVLNKIIKLPRFF